MANSTDASGRRRVTTQVVRNGKLVNANVWGVERSEAASALGLGSQDLGEDLELIEYGDDVQDMGKAVGIPPRDQSSFDEAKRNADRPTSDRPLNTMAKKRQDKPAVKAEDGRWHTPESAAKVNKDIRAAKAQAANLRAPMDHPNKFTQPDGSQPVYSHEDEGFFNADGQWVPRSYASLPTQFLRDLRDDRIEALRPGSDGLRIRADSRASALDALSAINAGEPVAPPLPDSMSVTDIHQEIFRQAEIRGFSVSRDALSGILITPPKAKRFRLGRLFGN